MTKKYILELAVFLCGGIVMIFELVGSRVLAPYLGNSIFVWTSLIGVILGSLSLGYWYGGIFSDKNPSLRKLSLIIFLSGVFIALTIITKELVLVFFQRLINYIELASLLSSLILFAPASILLGMVSPLAVKLKVNDLNRTGSTVGNLYAISTIGSIAGTFSAGFFLIPSLGTIKILLFLSLSLVVLSIIIYPINYIKVRLLFLLVIISSFPLYDYFDKLFEKAGFIDVDTKYNRVIIYQSIDIKSNRKILNLIIDPFGTQSAIFLEGADDLVFDYTKYYRLAGHFKPNLERSLLIGGAGYTYPRDYLKQFPRAQLDVVEIDEKITELAKKYFRLKDDPRLNIYHEDGRIFLNKSKNKYDVIFGDAFLSLASIPYHLTTKEAVTRIYEALNDNGIVLLNIISSIEGKSGKFLRAEYATYRSIFKQVYLFPVGRTDSREKQNIILMAFKSSEKLIFKSSDQELNSYLKNLWQEEIVNDIPILTDDYAPVDYYIREAI